jgi:hypothetical protein
MQDPLEAIRQAASEAGPLKALVTGLGRGGTTAVASMLYHAGFNLSGLGSPDSYFEDESLRSHLLGRDFARVEAELESRVARFGLVAWKDPKLYSEFGTGLLRSLAQDWTLIAVFRDPVAIVSRRVAADQVDFNGSMERVMRFMRKLQKFAAETEKSRKVIYVSYEKIMTEPIASIMVTMGKLGIRLDEACAAHIWTQMRGSQQVYLTTVDGVASATVAADSNQ